MDKWEALKKAGAHEDRIPAFVGLSRATYYRDKQHLNALDWQGLTSTFQTAPKPPTQEVTLTWNMG